MKCRIYISAFEVLPSIAPSYTPLGPETDDLFDLRHPVTRPHSLSLPSAGIGLLRKLRSKNLQFTLFSDFWSYLDIEDEIDSACGLLAIVDSYYRSSTGRMNDISAALGHPRNAHGTRAAPKPVFFFPADPADAAKLLRSFSSTPAPIVISSDPSVAADQVAHSIAD